MSGFYVRSLSPDMTRELRQEAAKNRRSMQDEAAVLIEEALQARETAAKRAARDARPLATSGLRAAS